MRRRGGGAAVRKWGEAWAQWGGEGQEDGKVGAHAQSERSTI